CCGIRNSSRKARSGSAASRARALASEKSSFMACGRGFQFLPLRVEESRDQSACGISATFKFTPSLEAKFVQAQPVHGRRVEQLRLLGLGHVQREDAAAGLLFAERERIISAEHHRFD